MLGLLAFNTDTQDVNSSGLVYYGDFKLDVDYLEWGQISPGETVIKNVSFSSTDKLQFNVTYSNFEPPEIEQYFIISYELIDNTFTFMLTVSEDIRDITYFSFDITITEV